LGVACRDYAQSASLTGDYSYLVSEIGRPGVPRPSRSEIETVNRIKKYVHSKHLRFEYLGRQFIVYDATHGPCDTGAPAYLVLNAPGCNLYYSPTDDFDSPKAIPDPNCTPEPWNRKKRR
jgi:hypothetical protein